MAQIFGALGYSDSDLIFTTVEGQMVIWEATQRAFDLYNEDLEASVELFIDGTTTGFKERYYLPGGGESQQEDITRAAETAAIRTVGNWDVAFPLEQGGDSIAYDDIGIRSVSMQRYDATVQTVFMRNNNFVFGAILRALFRNVNATFSDPDHGDLTLVPLANQDGTLYPPPVGASAEAQQNFFVGASYAESGISNTNNPFATLKTKLEAIHGLVQGGSPIIALVNSSILQYVYPLAGFEEYTNRYAEPGDNITRLLGLPRVPPGMRIVGVDTISSVVVVEWPRVPTGYVIGLHQNAKPLRQRLDLPAKNFPRGLHLWSDTLERREPYRTARWRDRRGFAVANRLGAVVMHLSGAGTYTIPSTYA
jgi:hypothetical protein